MIHNVKRESGGEVDLYGGGPIQKRETKHNTHAQNETHTKKPNNGAIYRKTEHLSRVGGGTQPGNPQAALVGLDGRSRDGRPFWDGGLYDGLGNRNRLGGALMGGQGSGRKPLPDSGKRVRLSVEIAPQTYAGLCREGARERMAVGRLLDKVWKQYVEKPN